MKNPCRHPDRLARFELRFLERIGIGRIDRRRLIHKVGVGKLRHNKNTGTHTRFIATFKDIAVLLHR
jgi:hypothetical protein